jgi:hypothetical protein
LRSLAVSKKESAEMKVVTLNRTGSTFGNVGENIPLVEEMRRSEIEMM